MTRYVVCAHLGLVFTCWKAKRLTDGIMQSLSSARQSEVKAWEEEIIACEHALLLEQLASGAIPAEGEPSISDT